MVHVIKIKVTISKEENATLERLARECFPGKKRARELVIEHGLDLLEKELARA